MKREMYKVTLILMIISIISAESQIEYSNWYFGNKAGIRFENDTVVAQTDGAYDFVEGISILSDENGNLIMYSSGDRVFNKDHNEMLNGSKLSGSESSTQSSLILKHPKSDSLYYIFTIDNNGIENGFQYSIADLSKNSGNGEITSAKNIPIHFPVCEKITAVFNHDRSQIWILVHEWESNRFLAYPFDVDGFRAAPVISSTGFIHEGNDGFSGYMKVSPRGDLIALVSKGLGKIELSKFNNRTGEVSDSYIINDDFIEGVYGVEFSPDGSKLYISTIGSPSQIIQFDLSKPSFGSIKESRLLIKSYESDNLLGSIQLGPDERIYISKYNQSYLDVILHPNKSGNSCEYVEDKVYLKSGKCRYGLPSFNQSLLYKDPDCLLGSFEYSYFFHGPNLRTNGSSQVENKQLYLTTAVPGSFGSIWSNEKLDISKGFEINFSFSTSEGKNVSSYNDNSEPGGDGFAFVIQNSSRDAIGRSGWGMGYHGITNAFAVEFDLFFNDSAYFDNIFDKNGNHVAVQISNMDTLTAYHSDLTTLSMNNDIIEIVHDKIFYVKIIYHPEKSQFMIFLNSERAFDEPIITINDFKIADYINLYDDTAFIGFTAATGDCYQNHIIHDWNVCLLNQETTNTEIQVPPLSSSVYPNPADDFIIVRNRYDYQSVKIVDLIGNIVWDNINTNETSDYIQINCSNLTVGSYYLIMIGKNIFETYPILIIR